MKVFVSVIVACIIVIDILFFNYCRVSVKKDLSIYKKKVIGYYIWINSFRIKINIRDKRRTNLNEEISFLKEEISYEELIKKMSAKVSWLKTEKEVIQFEKDYSKVNNNLILLLANKQREKIKNGKV